MSESVSLIQAQYTKAHLRHHKVIQYSRIAILIIFLAIWELSTDMHWIDGFFFSSPSRVIRCFITLLKEQHLLSHIGITLMETLISFGLVTIISLFSAMLLWYSTKLSEISEPFLVVLNSLPKSALAPLFIVWLGSGIKTIIVAGISVAIFGSIISLYAGFKQVDQEKAKLIYTLGGNKQDVFSKVVLPGSIPILFSAMKVNIGLALVGVVIGEFLSARKGLGYLIIYGSQVFRLDYVIMSIIVLCIIAILLYQIIQLLEHYYKKH
ncbi:MAG: ABC transporter permease [Lachnospiraceae bacterium]